MQKILIAIVGPTAIGKTERAINLAHHFETDIVSADSRQFFKEMRIGTAVPSNTELQQVVHHLIQHKSIGDSYTVGDFENEAIELLNELFKEKDIAVVVGGSGLYMDALLYGLDDFPEVKPSIRVELNRALNEDGLGSLQQQLKDLDPEYYQKVDLENPHRVIRALEVCIASGMPYSSFLGKKKKKHDFKPIILGLNANREIIYQRINQRVDLMIQNGLIEEAKELNDKRHLNALNTVGYKELFEYFDGVLTLDEAIGEIKKNTRRFAKRQLTWYSKNKEVHWINHDLPNNKLIELVTEKIKPIANA